MIDQLELRHNLLQHNLNFIVRFYNELKCLLENKAKDLEDEINGEMSNKDIMTLKIRRSNYQWFKKMLIKNCFLMIHSHLEEILFHFVGKPDKEEKRSGIKKLMELFRRSRPKKKKRLGIKRFIERFEKKYGFRIDKFQKWSYIVNCSKVRDLILHANGNISIAKEPVKAKETCKKLYPNVKIEKSQIVLEEGILQEFAAAATGLRDYILENIKKHKAQSAT